MTSEVWFKLIIDLITALSGWLYPLVILIGLLLYRKPISALLDRVKKGELFGNKFELEPAVDEFQESVQEVEKEVFQLKEFVQDVENNNEESLDDSKIAASESKQTEIDVNQILDDSKGSPELAIIRLSNLIENESTAILGSMGFLPQHPRRLSAYGTIQELEVRGLLPKNTIKSIKQFSDLRNRIVHGKGIIDEKEILRVLDIGIVLLRTIRSIPHEIHSVHQLVDVFEDAECKNKRADVKGVLIASRSSDGMLLIRMFHTSKINYYEIGKRVIWEWDLSKKFDEGWYFDNKSGRVTKINASLDFIGRQIDEISPIYR